MPGGSSSCSIVTSVPPSAGANVTISFECAASAGKSCARHVCTIFSPGTSSRFSPEM